MEGRGEAPPPLKFSLFFRLCFVPRGIVESLDLDAVAVGGEKERTEDAERGTGLRRLDVADTLFVKKACQASTSSLTMVMVTPALPCRRSGSW
jgi:hypothetical protein